MKILVNENDYLINRKKNRSILLETRIHQRRKELEEIRQKSNRFNLSIVHLQSDTDRLLHMIEKAPDVKICFLKFLNLISFSFAIECGNTCYRN